MDEKHRQLLEVVRGTGGWARWRDLEIRTDGTRWSPDTLNRKLKDLVAAGWLVPEERPGKDGRLHRGYALIRIPRPDLEAVARQMNEAVVALENVSADLAALPDALQVRIPRLVSPPPSVGDEIQMELRLHEALPSEEGESYGHWKARVAAVYGRKQTWRFHPRRGWLLQQPSRRL